MNLLLLSVILFVFLITISRGLAPLYSPGYVQIEYDNPSTNSYFLSFPFSVLGLGNAPQQTLLMSFWAFPYINIPAGTTVYMHIVHFDSSGSSGIPFTSTDQFGLYLVYNSVGPTYTLFASIQTQRGVLSFEQNQFSYPGQWIFIELGIDFSTNNAYVRINDSPLDATQSLTFSGPVNSNYFDNHGSLNFGMQSPNASDIAAYIKIPRIGTVLAYCPANTGVGDALLSGWNIPSPEIIDTTFINTIITGQVENDEGPTPYTSRYTNVKFITNSEGVNAEFLGSNSELTFSNVMTNTDGFILTVAFSLKVTNLPIGPANYVNIFQLLRSDDPSTPVLQMGLNKMQWNLEFFNLAAAQPIFTMPSNFSPNGYNLFEISIQNDIFTVLEAEFYINGYAGLRSIKSIQNVSIPLFGSNTYTLTFGQGTYPSFEGYLNFVWMKKTFSAAFGEAINIPNCEMMLTTSLCLQCSTGFIFNTQTQSCVQMDNYLNCYPNNVFMNSNCSCSGGLYLQPTFTNYPYCSNTCPAGYYKNSVTQTCTACNSECSLCNDGTNTNCPQCAANKFRFGSTTCLTQCPALYNGNTTSHTCYGCDASCLTCNGITNTSCTSCKLLNQTIHNGACVFCTAPCYSCYGISNSECLSCQPGYNLTGHICTAVNCGVGRFYNGSACENCPVGCATCSSLTDCFTCNPNYVLNNAECPTCGSQIGFQSVNGLCVEICGDGRNFHMYQCDDGNNVNGDGCNSECFIEAGWTCSGGSPTTRDYCSVLSNVSVTSFGNTAGQIPSITLEFTELVTNTGNWENTLRIFLLPNFEEVTTFTVTPTSGMVFVISFNSETPRNAELQDIEVIDNNPSNLIDQFNQPVYFYPQKALVDFSYYNSSGFSNKTLKILIAIILGFAASLIFSGSAFLFWRFADMMQAFSYLGCISVQFPSLVNSLLELFAYARFYWLPNPFSLISSLFNLPPGETTPWKFQLNDYSSLFFMNAGQHLTWIGIELVLNRLFKIEEMVKNKSKFLFLVHLITLKSIIPQSTTMILAVLVAGFLQVLLLQWSNAFEALSSISGITIVFLTLLFAPYMNNFIDKNITKLKNSKFYHDFGPFYSDYKFSSPFKAKFFIIQIVAKIIFSGSLVLFNSIPVLQILGILLIKVAMATMIWINKPFREHRENIIQVANEIIQGICLINMLFFNWNIGSTVFLSILIILALIFNLIVALSDQIKLLRNCTGRRKSSNDHVVRQKRVLRRIRA